MHTVTFIADGKTKDFYFTFPFFLKTDVIIEVNSQPATNYTMICIKNGLNADIPFGGGRVHFNKPPKSAEVITIRRHLPLTRIADYQPTALYNPTALNHDFNYLMEVMKDMRSVVDNLQTQSTDTANSEQTDKISRQITQIISALDDINVRLDEIGQPTGSVDLSEIHSSIENLANSVDTLTQNVGTNSSDITRLSDFQNGVSDYVVESQIPTAANNYTWFRKYKSGWVEQGGRVTVNGTISATNTRVTFPVEMADTKYVAFCANNANVGTAVFVGWESTTSMSVSPVDNRSGLTTWYVAGLAKK